MQAKAVRSLRVDGVCGEGGWRFGNEQRQGRGEFGDVQCLMTMLAADHVGWVCWGQVDMRGTFNLQARGDAGPDQATVEINLGQPLGSSDRTLLVGSMCGGKEREASWMMAVPGLGYPKVGRQGSKMGISRKGAG